MVLVLCFCLVAYLQYFSVAKFGSLPKRYLILIDSISLKQDRLNNGVRCCDESTTFFFMFLFLGSNISSDA